MVRIYGSKWGLVLVGSGVGCLKCLDGMGWEAWGSHWPAEGESLEAGYLEDPGFSGTGNGRHPVLVIVQENHKCLSLRAFGVIS